MAMGTTTTMAAATAKTTSLMSVSLSRRRSSRLKVFSVKAASSSSSSRGCSISSGEFDPKIPIEKALTPPSSWYSLPSFHYLELDRIFYKTWQVVGCSEDIKNPGDYFTGRLGSIEFVVCKDDNGKVHAFHNVCRHHASLLAHGSGKKSCFVCPYHFNSLLVDRAWDQYCVWVPTCIGRFQGWTYGLNGPLLKATRITGIQNFNANEFGLIPIQVAIWGPFVLLNMEQKVTSDVDDMANEWLGSASEVLSNNGVDSSLSYICRREYTIECNWKVFCDNYLDGGYHVPYAHKGLASGLKLDSYSTTIFEKVSIQICEGGSTEVKDDYDRLGSKAFYAFVYPNFMINRYGPWMDTNLVLPLGAGKCRVVFDYFLEPSLKDDKDFIHRSLQDSERVQREDVALCEGVQRGLESPAYSFGRYAPTVEYAMHHFHCLLHSSLKE